MSISRMILNSANDLGVIQGAYTLDSPTAPTPFQRLNVGHKDIAPRGVEFKPDGTKVYFTGGGSRQIHQYNLSTAFDLGTNTYFGKVELGLRYPGALRFKPDGTKVYFINSSSTDYVEEWDLSTAWNITTASAHATYTITHEIYPSGLFFKPDGTRMYITGSNDDNCIEYDLSTAWDVTTASYSREVSTGISSYPRDVFFKTDGTKMYITEDVFGQNDNTIREYNLSTAWNVTTASFSQELQTENPAFNIHAKSGQIYGVHFKSDGTKAFYTGESKDRITGIDLSTAWDISTASWPTAVNTSGSGFYVDSAKSAPSLAINQTGFYMKPDGTSFFDACNTRDKVYRYDLSTAFDIGTASHTSGQEFSVATQSGGVGEVTFKPDGTKMYMVSFGNDAAYQYSLSTAWDLTTASYDNVSVSVQFGQPTGIRFKPDGTSMYITEDNSNDVVQYNLTTAWSISTASYAAEINLNSYQTTPLISIFSPDGTKMFVAGRFGSTNEIDEFTLTTAWDVSSATHVQVYDANTFGFQITGIDFNNDGSVLFVQFKKEVVEVNLAA